MMRMNFSIIVLAGIILFANIATAIERHVPSEYATIQAAIDASSNDDVVIIAPGTYSGAGNKDLDFAGKAITVKSTNPDDSAVVAATVIDCGNSGRGFSFHSGENANSILDGVTIRNGYVFTEGGGIYCSNSSPTIENCIITNNTATEDPNNPSICYGAGNCQKGSTAAIIGCEITSNSSPNNCFGGGIFCSGNPTIKNCKIKKQHNAGTRRGNMPFKWHWC